MSILALIAFGVLLFLFGTRPGAGVESVPAVFLSGLSFAAALAEWAGVL